MTTLLPAHQRSGRLRGKGTALARALCALVSGAAGTVGVAMLVAPESTGTFFSWPLGPAPLAALVGAFYVASAIVFGWAAFRESWAGVRTLCIAVFGLTVPTLISTYRHRDVFDFGRWQAVAWVLLFLGSVGFFSITLLTTRAPITVDTRVLDRRTRAVLALLAAVYAAVAVLLWIDPTLMARFGPIAGGGLGARFVGSWAAFLAILAVLAAVRPNWAEARTPVVALTVWPLAALGAAVAQLDSLRPGSIVGYLAALGLLAAVPAVIWSEIHRAGRVRPSTLL